VGFDQFRGNHATITQLREMLSHGRFPHAVMLSGPTGSGKYTLAQMLSKAMNCLDPQTTDGLPDFCGSCSNCSRIAQADDLDARVAEAVEAREGMRDVDKKETRILIQSHPEVVVVPPDPPQNLIKIGQVRKVIEGAQYKPVEAKHKIYVFSESRFMKEAANALLKLLEEPPPYATIFLLTENPGMLLPTIRSRCVSFSLHALPLDEIERDLAERRPEWNSRQRHLVARLSGGALGRAYKFDLATYATSRQDALLMLQTAAQGDDHSALFRATETYRAGADGGDKTDSLIRATYSLLEDLLYLRGDVEDLVRNIDIMVELKKLAGSVDFDWIRRATQGLGQVESGMRRNLLRNVSLDAFVATMER